MKPIAFFLLVLFCIPLTSGSVPDHSTIILPAVSSDFEYVIDCNTTRKELREIVQDVHSRGLGMKVTKKRYKKGKLRVIAFQVTAPKSMVIYSTTYIFDGATICIRYKNGQLSAGACKP